MNKTDVSKVREYRVQNPNCYYCIHNGGCVGNSGFLDFCKAKQQHILNHKKAKQCTLFSVKVSDLHEE